MPCSFLLNDELDHRFNLLFKSQVFSNSNFCLVPDLFNSDQYKKKFSLSLLLIPSIWFIEFLNSTILLFTLLLSTLLFSTILLYTLLALG